MSFFQNPSFYIQTAETDIVNFFTKVKAGLEVVSQDFLNVLGWVQSDASEIAQLVAGLIGVVAGASGGQIPAALLSAQAALNAGMQLVNTAVSAAQGQSAGGADALTQATAALAAAYAQFKQAQAAAATQAGSTAQPTTASTTTTATSS